MLSSEFAEEMTDFGLILNQKWLDEMYLATSAFDQQDHIEAERHLRCALEETNSWDSVDGRTYNTLVLYAAAMSALGRFDRVLCRIGKRRCRQEKYPEQFQATLVLIFS